MNNNTVTEVTDISVTFKTYTGHITIHKGRITSNAGYATPAEVKKAFKTYYAITNSK